MDPDLGDIAERNRTSVARLREVGEAHSDLELANVIDDPWTSAALFAHIAFWDRFVLERWRLADEQGRRTPASLDDAVMDRLNDASLRQWLAIPPRVAVEECLAAATDLDEHLAGLDPEIVADVVSEGRQRLVDRSLHRSEHIRTIDGAFPTAP